MHAPTDRPDEHVMAGAPIGPGPGPEVLTPNLAPDPLITTVAALNHVDIPELRGLKASLAAHADNLSAP